MSPVAPSSSWRWITVPTCAIFECAARKCSPSTCLLFPCEGWSNVGQRTERRITAPLRVRMSEQKMSRVFSLGPRQHPNHSFVSGKLLGPSAWQAGGSDICHKMSSFSKNQMNWDVNMKNEFQLLVFWILNSHWKKIGVWTKLNSSKENACNDWKSCWK